MSVSYCDILAANMNYLHHVLPYFKSDTIPKITFPRKEKKVFVSTWEKITLNDQIWPFFILQMWIIISDVFLPAKHESVT